MHRTALRLPQQCDRVHQTEHCSSGLPFTLLSDSSKKTAEAYGALGFLGMAQRAYVLIDEEGKVLLAYSDFLPITYQPMKDLLLRIDRA